MAIFNVTIGGFNNLPPNQIGNKSISLIYDETYIFTLADFTTGTTPPYQDPEGDALEEIKIISLPLLGTLTLNDVPLVINSNVPFLDLVSGNVKYISDNTELSGYKDTSFTFDASDVGSSTFSGLTPGVITFNVGAQENLPPSEVGDGSATIDYGATLVFTGAMFSTDTVPAYSDPEGDSPALLKITSLPTDGVIQYNGSAVQVNDIISFTDINLGLLTYVSDLVDTDGDLETFTFEVADSGSGEFVA